MANQTDEQRKAMWAKQNNPKAAKLPFMQRIHLQKSREQRDREFSERLAKESRHNQELEYERRKLEAARIVSETGTERESKIREEKLRIADAKKKRREARGPSFFDKVKKKIMEKDESPHPIHKVKTQHHAKEKSDDGFAEFDKKWGI